MLTTIKEKLRLLKSRSGKKEKVDQQCQLEELIDRQNEPAPLSRFLDNMGAATTNMIIKRRIDKYIYTVYGIGNLKNDGRFYIDRVTEANGSIIKTLLVDKQNGMTRTLYKTVGNILS